MDFRFATEADTPLILHFIKELAEYEKMLDLVVADEKTQNNNSIIINNVIKGLANNICSGIGGLPLTKGCTK